MRKVKDLFEAKADNLWDTLTSHGGSAGFRIPEYQRTYDWGQEKIARLLEDCANGLYQLRRRGAEESYTFLGTLILVNERSETTFDGRSLAIVDGQQRLTTLLLICCALIEKISANLRAAEDLSQAAKTLILDEAEMHIGELFECIVGELPGLRQRARYPRIIRHEDKRAKERRNWHYSSTIARFLWGFSEHYSDFPREEFKFPEISDSDGASKRLWKNYDFIKSQIAYIADLPEQVKGIDCERVPCIDFERKGYTNLLPKIDRQSRPGRNDARDEMDQICSEISKTGASNSLVRLVLFASYISRCVVLTRVETEDEDSAFDIFDALNTTGEPLTAIETLKPRVIQTETRGRNTYTGSISEIAFGEIERRFEKIESPYERQKEAREIVVSFALYTNGEKVANDLREQRRYLGNTYDQCGPIQGKRRFVEGLAEITQFRNECWNKDGIREATYLEPNTRLCLQTIKDMNTSLALPPIARYWSKRRETGGERRFAQIVKAVTAFLILRRSVTGTTGGIDSVLRGLMKQQSKEGDPLCVGLGAENELLNVTQLRTHLRSLLASRPIEVTSKASWVGAVREVPIANHAKALAKFLILAASQYAKPDPKQPGLLTRDGFRESDEQDYLTYEKWTSAEYKTIEHVAPVTDPGEGWDGGIYSRPYIRHTLGNLVLLPQKENASLGNSVWRRKQLFYLALTETDDSEQERWLREAEEEELEFPKKTRDLIKRGRRLHLLDPIRNVQNWDEALIRARTENILGLAWDTLADWLWE